MNTFKKYAIAKAICKKYGVEFKPYNLFTNSDGCYVYKYKGYKDIVVVKLNCDHFLEVFFHELGHHVYRSNKYHKGQYGSDSIMEAYYDGRPLECTLHEEAFASAFARKAMIKMGIDCDVDFLVECFQSYAVQAYKFFNKVSSKKEFVSTLTSVVSSNIDRISGRGKWSI